MKKSIIIKLNLLMSKLYGITIDNRRWKIDEAYMKSNNICRLVDKTTNTAYVFQRPIGLTQVSDNEFIVYRRFCFDEFEIIRYKLENSKIEIIFEKKFGQCKFISDDRILFTYNDQTETRRCSGVYSIKDNKMLEKANFLDGNRVTVYEASEGYQIYVEEELFSILLRNPKLIYAIDASTLEVNSDVHSELRGSFIKADNNEELDNIREEDLKYIRIIEEQDKSEKKKKMQRIKQQILKRK